MRPETSIKHNMKALNKLDEALGVITSKSFKKKMIKEFKEIENDPGVSNNYNSGVFNPFYGKKHTQETKDFLTQKQLGVPIHTEEHKKELSRKFSGKGNPMYGRTKEKNPFYGKTHTPEVRAIIKAKRKLQITTEETKAKMSASAKKRWRLIKLNKEKK